MHILDVFTGHYQAMYVPFRDRGLVTVLHVAILKVKEGEKLPLYVINHHAMKTYGDVQVYLYVSRYKVVVNIHLHALSLYP
jgi:hypothetical protein